MAQEKTPEDLQQEIEHLKHQLHLAQSNDVQIQTPDTLSTPKFSGKSVLSPFSSSLLTIHSLLLLADSALPLGSFAYSSGLESYLAHTKTRPTHKGSTTASIDSFYRFLELSLSSLAGTTLPYLLKAHRFPSLLENLDNDFDAATPCTVARRASVAQGLALLGVWERAFKMSYKTTTDPARGHEARTALDAFSSALKDDPADAPFGCPANGHFAPLWSVVCVAMDVDIEQAGYVFMLNHAKAVLSAAVRASVMGPYQAQAMLASNGLQSVIRERLREQWRTEPDMAGQVVPVMDLWMGRHELLYSRIFNS